MVSPLLESSIDYCQITQSFGDGCLLSEGDQGRTDVLPVGILAANTTLLPIPCRLLLHVASG